jgi:hypothetical protein
MSFKEISKATNIKELKLAMKGSKGEPLEKVEIDKNIVYEPSLPRVNVVPLTVFEKYQVKGIARKFLFIGAGVAGVFALAFAGGAAYMGVGNAELDKLNAQQADITAEVSVLQPYELYKVSIEGKRTALYTSVEKDIDMGGIYASVNSASGNNSVEVKNIAVKQYEEGEEGASCVNPDPFGDSAGIIGCIQLSGTGPDKDSVNGFLRQLEGNDALSASYKNPFISAFTTAEGGEGEGITSTFTATIAFTNRLYTNQYASLALTLTELIAKSDPQPTEGTDPADPTAPVVAAGYAGEQALVAVPSLATTELANIDNIANSVCNTPEEQRAATVETASEAVQAIIETNNADIDAAAITVDLMDAITNNCTAVINNATED